MEVTRRAHRTERPQRRFKKKVGAPRRNRTLAARVRSPGAGRATGRGGGGSGENRTLGAVLARHGCTPVPDPGTRGRSRTSDPLLVRQTLFQLSYAGAPQEPLAGCTRIELVSPGRQPGSIPRCSASLAQQVGLEPTDDEGENLAARPLRSSAARKLLVGAEGFEPSASRIRTGSSSRLSYTPRWETPAGPRRPAYGTPWITS